MKLHTRLLGGASALAATARALIDDEGGAAAAAAPTPEDEQDDGESGDGAEDDGEPSDGQKKTGQQAAGAAAAPVAPAAAAAAPAGAAAEDPSPENLVAFAAGVESRNADIGEVFSARVKGEDGKDGELVVAGREAAAAELLSAGLTADQTIKTLGRLPKGTQGDAMLDALRTQAGKAPDLQPGGSAQSGSESKAVWDRVANKKGFGKPAK